MTDHADTIRPERVERVEQWANLYGNELVDILRLDPEDDAATLDAIDDALMLVEDVYAARHERDALLVELQQAQKDAENLREMLRDAEADVDKLREQLDALRRIRGFKNLDPFIAWFIDGVLGEQE